MVVVTVSVLENVQIVSSTVQISCKLALAYVLSLVTGHLEEKEASRQCGIGSALMVEAMGRAQSGIDLDTLAALVGRLEPKEATRICNTAAALVVQDMENAGDISEPDIMGPRFTSVYQQQHTLAERLSSVLICLPEAQRTERLRMLTGAVGLGAGSWCPFVPWVAPALEPLPCRLGTQELVELLKHPFCVGRIREVVLQQLSNRYHRPFATVWEFVAFAREQQLDLDFTTSPQRVQTPRGVEGKYPH